MTAEEIVLGIVVAAVAALALAIAMHFFATVRAAVYPLLIASQTIPIPMLAPVLVLWLGFGILPKLVVIALVSFFSIVVTTLAGFASVDPELLKLMRTFDAPRRRVFWSIELPTALPGVFTGAKIAVIVAVIGAVFAEQSGANSGLGYLFAAVDPPAAIPRARTRPWSILSAFAIALFVASDPGRAAGHALGPSTESDHPMRRRLALAGRRRCWPSLAALPPAARRRTG